MYFIRGFFYYRRKRGLMWASTLLHREEITGPAVAKWTGNGTKIPSPSKLTYPSFYYRWSHCLVPLLIGPNDCVRLFARCHTHFMVICLNRVIPGRALDRAGYVTWPDKTGGSTMQPGAGYLGKVNTRLTSVIQCNMSREICSFLSSRPW